MLISFLNKNQVMEYTQSSLSLQETQLNLDGDNFSRTASMGGAGGYGFAGGAGGYGFSGGAGGSALGTTFIGQSLQAQSFQIKNIEEDISADAFKSSAGVASSILQDLDENTFSRSFVITRSEDLRKKL